jgi:hypothetical protein
MYYIIEDKETKLMIQVEQNCIIFEKELLAIKLAIKQSKMETIQDLFFQKLLSFLSYLWSPTPHFIVTLMCSLFMAFIWAYDYGLVLDWCRTVHEDDAM